MCSYYLIWMELKEFFYDVNDHDDTKSEGTILILVNFSI